MLRLLFSGTEIEEKYKLLLLKFLSYLVSRSLRNKKQRKRGKSIYIQLLLYYKLYIWEEIENPGAVILGNIKVDFVLNLKYFNCLLYNFINIFSLIIKYNVVYNNLMSEFKDTDDKVKDDVEDTGDKIKSGIKATGNKIKVPSSDLGEEYNKEKSE